MLDSESTAGSKAKQRQIKIKIKSMAADKSVRPTQTLSFVDKIWVRARRNLMAAKRTLFEKVWDEHVVCSPAGSLPLLYIDLHLVHEVTSPQAFDGLRAAGRKVRQPQRTVATVDHNIPTEPRGTPITDPIAARQIEALQKNCNEFGVPLFDMDSPTRASCT